MRWRKGRTSSAQILGRVLAIIASGVSSTWNEWVRPPSWSVTVGRLEPQSAESMPPVSHSGPRTYCDRCEVAHTRYIVILPSGLEIHFCHHHYHKHRWALATAGFEVRELPE